jgi:hypothetical protein
MIVSLQKFEAATKLAVQGKAACFVLPGWHAVSMWCAATDIGEIEQFGSHNIQCHLHEDMSAAFHCMAVHSLSCPLLA